MKIRNNLSNNVGVLIKGEPLNLIAGAVHVIEDSEYVKYQSKLVQMVDEGMLTILTPVVETVTSTITGSGTPTGPSRSAKTSSTKGK